MRCPDCQTSNPGQARYCMGCGRLLVSGLVCWQCHTFLPVEARYCYHCGAFQARQPERFPELPLDRQQPLPAFDSAVTSMEMAERCDQSHSTAEADRPNGVAAIGGSASLVARDLGELLPSLKAHLPEALYEPLERRPKPRDLIAVRDHLTSLLQTLKTYLPHPVALAPQPPGRPNGGMVQGTFLFGDVSGFTPLSEKLKVLGQEGAERITAIINHLFSQLVDVLFAHGGTLLKFGGDALLGVFPATSADEIAAGALHAAQAGLAMQAIMRQEAFSAIKPFGDAPGNGLGRLATTPPGADDTYALKIKCGISAGPYFAAHVGTLPDAASGRRSMMAYVTTGHTVNLAEEAEGHADPGEVVMTLQTYELIADQVEAAPVTKSPDAAFLRLLAAPPNPEAAQRPYVQEPPDGEVLAQVTYLIDRLDQLTPYLSEELSTRISLNPTDARIMPDHRPVTVMFVNYLGISPLIEDMGESHPGIIVAQLNAYFNRMASIVEKYEGSLARMDQYAVGDRLVIFFGAPRAHEDDPIRAIHAALEMAVVTRDHFSALQTPMGIYRFRQRIGINTGTLFAGNVGAPDLRQEYTLMGDDINTAARLMSYADWGDIYISNKTGEFARAFFELSEPFDLKVKGKTSVITTFKVLGSRREVGRTRGLSDSGTPLVGRESALASLQAVSEQWTVGRGQIVAVTGGTGQGKTRLIREYKNWLEQSRSPNTATPKFTWIEARSLSFSEQMAYWLAQELFRNLLAIEADTRPDDQLFTLWEQGEALLGKERARETVPFLADMLGLALEGDWASVVSELPPKVRQKETFWAVREMLTAIARTSPLAIVLDDLHWADEASLAMISELLSVTDQAPVLVLTAFRDRRDKGCWDLRNHAHAHYPHRTREIALQGLDRAQSQALLEGLLPGARFDMDTLRKIIDKAAGNPLYLEELARSLIETGAVIPSEGREPGMPVHWAVNTSIGEITVPDTLRAAIVSRIDRLSEDARYALQMASVIGRQFKVELLKGLIEAETEIDFAVRTYQWLAQLERGDLIRPSASSLPSASGLASASSPASTPQTGSAAASPVYTFPDAMVQEVAYDSLLVQSRAQLHARIGETLEGVLGEQAEQECELLAYHFGRGNDDARALRYLAMAAHKARRQYANETAIQHYERILGLQRKRGDQVGQADTLYQMGVMAYEIGDYRRARSWLEASIDLLRALGDPKNEAWSVMYLGMIDLKQGFYADAMRHHEHALALARSRGDTGQEGIHLTNLARVVMRLGNYEQALSIFDRSLTIKRANNDLVGQGFVHFYQGLIQIELQGLDAAEADLAQALAAWSQVPHNDRVMSYYHYGVGLLALAREAWEDAQQHLRNALAVSERLMLNAEIVEILSALAQVEFGLGRLEEAVQLSTQAMVALDRQKDVEEVQRIYFNHYLMLRASGNPDASSFLEQAHALMLDRAERIEQDAARRTYLEKVGSNRLIANAYA